jgi:protein-S-isoprenylcysteine O-methyltransferase Ste14
MKYRLITLVSAAAFLSLLGAIMFLIARKLALPSIWLYLGLRLAFTVASVVVMSDEVAHERLKPGGKTRPEPLYNIGTAIAFIALIIIVPLDLGRFGWSRGFPVWLHGVGVLVMLAGFTLVVWALVHNEYMSARLRIQGDRDQTVVHTGPYAIVRHPNYAGGFLVSLSSGLVFGSWVAVLPMLLHMVLLMVRTLQEEKMLLDGLPGYGDYAHRVRWRFLPGIW